MSRLACTLLLGLFGLLVQDATAQVRNEPQAATTAGAPRGEVSAPARGSTLIVSLITLGQGDFVWERFGHNALRFRDTASGADVAYNWGIFDFSEEGFMIRFLLGKGRYMMGGTRTSNFIRSYEGEDRHIWEQELNLTSEQKAMAYDLVIENEKPENVYYNYNYYLDNCSTRVRDLLNRILGDQLRAATDSIATGQTFRSHTRRLLADDNASYFGIQLVLGRPADRPISRWEEMFLPVRLMQHINEVKVRDRNGQMVPLVSNTREINIPVRRPPEPGRVSPRTLAYLGIGVGLAVLLVILARAGSNGARAGTVSFTILATIWGVIAGLAGTIALCMWLFTQHSFMYLNETLLLMNPLHLVLGIVLPFTIRAARHSDAAMLLGRSIAVLSAIGLVTHFIPGIGQANPEMLALAVPPNLALVAGFAFLWGRRI